MENPGCADGKGHCRVGPSPSSPSQIGDHGSRTYLNRGCGRPLAYDRTAIESFGEFARLNFPKQWPLEQLAHIRAEAQATGKGQNSEKAGREETKSKPANRQSSCINPNGRHQVRRKKPGLLKASTVRRSYIDDRHGRSADVVSLEAVLKSEVPLESLSHGNTEARHDKNAETHLCNSCTCLICQCK